MHRIFLLNPIVFHFKVEYSLSLLTIQEKSFNIQRSTSCSLCAGNARFPGALIALHVHLDLRNKCRLTRRRYVITGSDTSQTGGSAIYTSAIEQSCGNLIPPFIMKKCSIRSPTNTNQVISLSFAQGMTDNVISQSLI